MTFREPTENIQDFKEFASRTLDMRGQNRNWI